MDPSVETASKRDSRSERQFAWGLSCPVPETRQTAAVSSSMAAVKSRS